MILISFEQAFSDTERAAESTRKAADDLKKRASALKGASQRGNIDAIRRSRHSLEEALNVLRQEARNVSQSWPFDEEGEERYLSENYAAELIAAAQEIGLKIYEQDGSLISYPSVVSIQSGDPAVRIDGKLERNIKPSRLAKTLLRKQQKPGRGSYQGFLQSLYTVYSDIVSESSASNPMTNGVGRVVRLERVYRLLTAFPGMGRQYGRSDFARDLYLIETNGPRTTRRGHRVDFPSSTGTRRRSDLFHFIAPDGQRITYYGIRFTKDDQ